MPRTAALFNAVVFEKEPKRRISSISSHYTEEMMSESKTAEVINIIHDANMDGVRHLKDENRCVRVIWAVVILTFVILALIQITWQIAFYYNNPIATNVEVEYPPNVTFPAVAICNNNQFRLTHITGDRVQFRNHDPESAISGFDKAVLQSFSLDAVAFLRQAGHEKTRMILSCHWPNGRKCRNSDWKLIWTMTGLCWAINTSPTNPYAVSGSGAGHGLRLLLNVENYERIEACSDEFRSSRQPGLKIIIYNQTDVPETSMSGVNVPPGHSMDIPFKMQHRQKMSTSACIEETEEHVDARSNFSSANNIRTCAIRHYLREIERTCDCSLDKMFDQWAKSVLPPCNVGQYITCASKAIDAVRESGGGRGCLPPCETVQFTAWQDMNRLPRNIMPPLVVEDEEEEDEMDVESTEFISSGFNKEKQPCTVAANYWLNDEQVIRIKRRAARAFEATSRFQDDVKERTRRMIERLKRSVEKVANLSWGWHADELTTPFERILNASSCFRRLASREESLLTQMNRASKNSEESTTKHVYSLVDEAAFKAAPDRFKTIGGLKERYGQIVDDRLKECNDIISAMEKLWSIFDDASYFSSSVTADLTRMDRIFELMKEYEMGTLSRRVWAEKMESRQMRHFFEEEFMDGWSSPILRDLEKVLIKTISELESAEWASVNKSVRAGTAGKIGAILFFSSSEADKRKEFEKLLLDMYECATGEVKEESRKMLTDFKKIMRELQSAYNNIFKKELPEYLELYEFGDKFERENFAMVNIFLHEMHLEHWRQYQTYSIWSLACDVGGALGLFVGASLLTLIEMIYLCIKHGICSKRKAKEAITWVREASMRRRKTGRRVGGARGGPEEEMDEDDEDVVNEKKRSIWGTPPVLPPPPPPEQAALLETTDDPLTESVSESSSAQPLFSSSLHKERYTDL